MGEAGSAEQAAPKATKAESQPSAAASFAADDRPSNIVAGSFVVLVPGVGGALNDDQFLRGNTFLISGTFPEVGGGDEDAVGVANIKATIQSFGGKGEYANLRPSAFGKMIIKLNLHISWESDHEILNKNE